jgi:hypothetical protein
MPKPQTGPNPTCTVLFPIHKLSDQQVGGEHVDMLYKGMIHIPGRRAQEADFITLLRKVDNLKCMNYF